jgi:monoterpene epsilon-lactone hydrolase
VDVPPWQTMVMGKRPDVRTASGPITAVTLFGLGEQLLTGLAKVPLRRPWEGPSGTLDNMGRSVTRQVMRSFMGYSSSLPIPEFRSLEMAIDEVCRVVLPPVVQALDVDMHGAEVGGVPGMWYRRKNGPALGTILYLHGGGYIGTSPLMYAAFTGYLARDTGCDVFVADYRLAPEFPFPAGLIDAIGIYEALIDEGARPDRIFVAGDSGGGGLATSLLLDSRAHHLPPPAGVVLFSPEVDLALDEPSIVENAESDILPWNIPVGPYLRGIDPHNKFVSAVYADLSRYPPTFVAFGDEEMFRDPIRRFVDRLRDARVEVTCIEEPAMFHVFPMLMPWADASRRVYRAVGEFVRDHLPPPSTGEERHTRATVDQTRDDDTARSMETMDPI